MRTRLAGTANDDSETKMTFDGLRLAAHTCIRTYTQGRMVTIMTITSFAIGRYGQCYRRHVVGQRVVSDIGYGI